MARHVDAEANRVMGMRMVELGQELGGRFSGLIDDLRDTGHYLERELKRIEAGVAPAPYLRGAAPLDPVREAAIERALDAEDAKAILRA